MKTLKTTRSGWFEGRFSKRFVSLLCLSIPLITLGQPLRLLTSDPADGAVGIPLQITVSFTFNAPIDTSRVGETDEGPRYVVFPITGVQTSSPRYSADLTTLIFDVTHDPGIDVTWAFLNLFAADGSPQPRIEVVRYTTAVLHREAVLTGRLTSDISDPNYNRAIVLLVSDLDWLEEDGGPNEALVTAGTTLPGQDIYAIRYVRPGSYFMAAFLFDGGSPIAIGVLKGMDNEARLITVTDQTLTGLDIHLQTFDFGGADPIDALDALAVVRPVMQTERPDARPIVLDGSNPSMPPTGLSDEWTVVYVTDSDSMVYFFETVGDRIRNRMSFRYSEIPEDERPDQDLADMKSIPSNAIGSQQAFGIALMNGMQTQLTAYPGGFDHHVRVGYVLSPFYTEYPGLVIVSSEPFWAIEYEVWQPDSLRTWSYLIDAATGSFIGRRYGSEPAHYEGGFDFIGSNPPDMSTNVPLLKVLEFTFSESVHVHHLEMNRNITAVPQPQVGSITISEDHRTIRIEALHAPDTDYTWVFGDVRSANGQMLQNVPVVRYTTRSDISTLTLSGGLAWGRPPSDMMNGGMVRNIIVLFDSPDYLRNGADGEPIGMVAAGTTEPWSDHWIIRNVRPGTYFPGVFQLLYEPDGGIELLAYGFMDNGMGEPAPVHVTDVSLGGILLNMRPKDDHHQPVGVMDVYEKARSLVRGSNPNARFVLAWGREDIDMGRPADGMTDDWMFIFYDESSGMVDQLYVDFHGIQEHVRFHLDDIPEEERVDPARITFLPDQFIRNADALNTALDNGLRALLSNIPDQNAWAQVGYQLSGFYDRYPTHLNASSNPYWEVTFNLEVYRNEPVFEILSETEAFFVIDAITGASITNTVSTGIESASDLPGALELLPNMPNPFNPSTVLGYRLSGALGGTPVRLSVYDVLGREVAVLVDGVMPAGEHLTRFDASRLPSGMYIAVLESGGQRRFRTMMLIK
jgi:hypothetical protein